MRLENPPGGEQENVAVCWLENPLSPPEWKKSPRYDLKKSGKIGLAGYQSLGAP